MLKCRPRSAGYPLLLVSALWAVACGPPTLKPGHPVEGQLRPGETVRYGIELQKGEFLHLEIDQVELDAVLHLYDPDGELVGEEVDTFYDGESEDLYLIPEKTGIYELKVGRFANQDGEVDPLRFKLSYSTVPVTEELTRKAEAYWAFTLGINRVHNLRDCEGALEGLQESVRLWQELQDPKYFSAAVAEVSKCYRNLGSLQQSVETIEAALGNSFIHRSPTWKAPLLQILGESQDRQGLFSQAAVNETEALRLYRLTGKERREGDTLMSLCTLKFSMGLTEEAAEHCRSALKLAQSRADRSLESRASSGLAVSLRALGHSTEAIEISTHAMDLMPEGSGERAHAYRFLASVSNDLGRHDQALEYLEKAEAIYLENDYLKRVVTTRIIQVRTLLRLNRVDEAYEVIQDTFALAQGLDPHLSFAKMFEVRARVLAEKEQLAEARADADEAFALIESIRPNAPDHHSRASLLAAKWRIYELRVDLAMAADREQPAGAAAGLRAAEQARARTLIDILNQPISAKPTEEADATLSLSEIQNRVLSDDTALLQFFLGSERSYSWLVTRHSLKAFQLPPKEEINAKARQVIDAVSVAEGSRPSDAPSRASLVSELSELLRLPETLSDLRADQLIVVADGNLHLLPFSMLPVGPARSDELVVDRFLTTYAPSATALATLRKFDSTTQPNGKIAILADPVFRPNDPRLPHAPSGPCAGDFDLPRLPQTQEEASAIASLASGGGDVFQGFEASKQLVVSGGLSDYQFLHFATHGIVDLREPDQASLVLSCFSEKGAPLDHQVTLYDLEKLQLKADLVVLSACRTAQGEHVFGEGLMGLTRGFMNAGVPRVVASLWTVQDSVTRELMEDFYSRMLEKGESPARALHEAQLELRKYRPEPYHWAAFVLQGEWR